MIFISKISFFIKKIFISKLFLIFLISFILRFYFVFNNYPFVFHPDEPTIINSTINLRYNLNPKHFDWPTTYYYLNYPLYGLFERGVGNLNRNIEDFNYVIKDIDYYVISRTLTAVLGSINVLIIYLIIRALGKDKPVAELGAVIFSLFPFHISRSALALTDVPMLLFASLAIFLLIKYINTNSSAYLFISCFFAGLSTSTKYNGYMIFISIFLVIFIIKGFKLKEWYTYLKCGVSSALGFLIGTPYSLLDYKTFFRADSPKGAVWQFQNVGSVDFISQVKGFFINFYNVSDLVGYIPLLFTIIFIFWYLYKKNFSSNENKIILIFIIQFLYIIWSVSGVEVQRAQYFILILLFIPIFSIYFYEIFKKKFILFFLIFLFSTSYVILKNSVENPVVSFYRNVRFANTLSTYNFRYNNKDMKTVLEYIGVESDKFSSKDFSIANKDTHFISDIEICNSTVDCKLRLISKFDSILKKDVIYLYEIKR